MGYLGYGAGAWFDRIPEERREVGAPPVGILHWVDLVAVHDAESSTLHLASTGRASPWEAPDPDRARARLGELEEALRASDDAAMVGRPWHGGGEGLPPAPPFEEAVEAARQAIGRGDVFQVNLAQRFELGACPDPWGAYRVLRAHNPAPYAGYFRLGDLHMLSASPELLVETRGAEVSTCPIAGTYPRAEDPAEDRARSRELRAHPKEQAEHVMLVDLERNDLGRVCTYGSVRVEDLLGVQSFATVHHLVSTVRGTLRDGVSPAEVLAAVFPGGTITGAPKIRATEIIRELEPRARGPYTGALGFVDSSGDQTWNISIRTVVVQGGAASVHAGAGIVWDSDPAREYRETVQKAKAFLELGGVSTRGVDLGG
jgi:para-aminobenzoate synthetase component 1